MVITLNNGKFTASTDSLGTQLISLKDVSGKEYIWQRDPALWKDYSPLLFPIIGNCRDGKTCIEDIRYEIPKHGFYKDTDFEVSAQNDVSVCFSITSTERTKEIYPYDFELSLAYTLNDNGPFMDYVVDNPKARDIAYYIGVHPGFMAPLEDGEKFNDYRLGFEQEEQVENIIYDLENHQFDINHRLPLLSGTSILSLEYSLFNNNTVFFQDLKFREVSIVNPVTRKGVEVDYHDFETITFWTPSHKEAPFLCVEPWNGSATCSDEDDKFLHKSHVQVLKPGESKSYHPGIRVL